MSRPVSGGELMRGVDGSVSDDIYPNYRRVVLLLSLGLWRFSGFKIDKAKLKQRLLIPEYLRNAMVDTLTKKEFVYDESRYRHDGVSTAPESAVLVFINPSSGGRRGAILQARLNELIGEQQVFDISSTKPSEVLQYCLGCLDKLASLGDNCAYQTRRRVRILVAGGDGTVGWVLGSIREYCSDTPLPVGIIPLGTGNDLSRSFGWGGSFPCAWKSAVKWYLAKSITCPVFPLDSWQVKLITFADPSIELPPAFKRLERDEVYQDDDHDRLPASNWVSFEGTFYNYFSIGMDAQIAYGFHHLRKEKPYLARGPVTNKIIYSGYGCTQGWFCTPLSKNPRLSGLNQILQLHIKRTNSSEWELLCIPSSVRSIVLLNLHNYAGGRKPWGHPASEYLEKKGFVEAQPDDGLLEIFGLKEGWHASFVMIKLITAKHLAQAVAVRIEIRAGKRNRSYLQMDGEPWRQPLSLNDSTMIEVTGISTPSHMINAK